MKINNITISEKELMKIFIQFLKDNNILKEFKSNLINTLLNTQNGSQNKILTYINPISILKQNKAYIGDELVIYKNLINFSCKWDRTKEGYHFWASLHKKWWKLIEDFGK